MTNSRTPPRKDRYYWIGIGIVCCVLIALELIFDDVLINSTTQKLNSTSKILIVLFGGSVLALVLTGVMRRYLLSQLPETTDESIQPKEASRALSVLPLIRAVLMTFVVIVAILVGLSELGVDIAPMLAGAGLAGIVLGMGAQSLLKDILAGVFYVLDDAFRIGEYVEFGDMRGTVERISLRSIQIRHHRGALQTVPYGTIQSVSNLSRDWVITKIMFQLPHDTDILKVKRIIKSISADLRNDPEYGPSFLEPLKFQGIYDIDLYGLTVRVKYMSIPGQQFLARREVFSRLKRALVENGIEFARRSVHVDASTEEIAALDDMENQQAKTS